ncbi:hypothetical protein MRB53_004534 [Persea americana]|uniref:Uncharacterized protein n=1 Tax=Persea americana TaxID=3435 RepID=A0ACC2MBM5_PERAE|nr:hypothetical protein MRB53_004534 [Persea americana]
MAVLEREMEEIEAATKAISSSEIWKESKQRWPFSSDAPVRFLGVLSCACAGVWFELETRHKGKLEGWKRSRSFFVLLILISLSSFLHLSFMIHKYVDFFPFLYVTYQLQPPC